MKSALKLPMRVVIKNDISPRKQDGLVQAFKQAQAKPGQHTSALQEAI